MSDLTEAQQQAQAALDKVMNCRFSNFDAGAVIHWVERGMYQVKTDPVSQPHLRGGSRALDDLLYHLEPFLAAAAVVIDRPDQYQPAVARIGGISNARDLRVEDFQRLVNARAALSRLDAGEVCAPETNVLTDERRGVGIGMAIAAGIVMRSWGEFTQAREILGAAGLDTLEKLKASGVDQYDIDVLTPVLATLPSDERQSVEEGK